MNTMHGSGPRKGAHARKGRKLGRRSMPRSTVAAFSPDFAGFSLTQLCTLIDLARAEAKRRLEVM
jgi:hypothetical protein